MLSRRGQKVLQYLFLRWVLRCVFHPTKVEADFPDRRSSLNPRAQLLQTTRIFRCAFRMDAESGEHQLAHLADFQVALIRRRIHRDGNGKNLLRFDFVQGGLQRALVFV